MARDPSGRFGLPKSQLSRFLIVGIFNSAFGFAVFSIFVVLGASSWLAVAGGNVAGLIFNYVSNGALVFRNLAWRNTPRFALSYLGLMTLNVGLLHVLTPVTGNTILAQALLTIPLAALSYLVLSRWVFKRSP